MSDMCCNWCGKEVMEKGFRDRLSIKKFGVSGLCQACQDKIFGGEKDFYGTTGEADVAVGE